MSPIGDIKILTFISTFMLNALTLKLSGFLSLLVQMFESAIQQGLAYASGVHERNSVPYARFALKKRHGFCAKAREKTCKGTD